MSLSESSQKFQFNWQPCKRFMTFNYFILCVALACIFAAGLHGLVKCVLGAGAFVYAAQSLRDYWRRPKVRFFSNGSKLFCRLGLENAVEIQHLKWQDWGYVIVLNAQHNGEQAQWFWLSCQLNELEKRNLRLMIRAQLKKACHSLPSITTNPVL